jgi:hypothetical protein
MANKGFTIPLDIVRKREILRSESVYKKYGVNNISQAPGVRDKINKTLLSRRYKGGLKKCSKCSVFQEVKNFHKDKTTQDSLTSQCVSCKNIVRKERTQTEEFKAKRRETRKKHRKQETEYALNKRRNDPKEKMISLLRTRLLSALKRNEKKGSAVRNLGCSVEFFMEYIQNKFTDGMTWENHGKWHLDHIRPLSSFDLSNIEDIKLACNYNNLQPLWASDNYKKSNKYTGKP